LYDTMESITVDRIALFMASWQASSSVLKGSPVSANRATASVQCEPLM
jgi:hypothetical protein